MSLLQSNLNFTQLIRDKFSMDINLQELYSARFSCINYLQTLLSN